jgi:hypothetical protein
VLLLMIGVVLDSVLGVCVGSRCCSVLRVKVVRGGVWGSGEGV